MVCTNCGKMLDDDMNICPDCGEVLIQSTSGLEGQEIVKKDETPKPIDSFDATTDLEEEQFDTTTNLEEEIFEKSTSLEDGVAVKKKSQKKIIIAVIAVILVLAIAGGVFYVFNRPKSPEKQKEILTEILNDNTDKNIVEFIFEDFDSDGTYEAFAITSLFEKTDDFYADSDIWFVNQESAQKIKEKVVCKNNGLLDIQGKRFASIEVKNDDTSFSYIYSADGENLVESDISGEYSGVVQVNGKVVIRDNEGAWEESVTKNVVDKDGNTETTLEKEKTTKKASTTKKYVTTQKHKTNKDETANEFKNIKVGDYIRFGLYDQDNNQTNGKEAIEWIVLDKQDDRIFVISKYAIDCQPYNDKDENVTWESCALRMWLNSEFMKSAFTPTQKNKIPSVTIQTEDNPQYGTEAGKKTQDKVFLLSIEEVEKYFSSDYDGGCQATLYARVHGASVYTNDDEYYGNSWAWWLRSPGEYQNRASIVQWDGELRYYGVGVFNDDVVVRPAMWINI